uniref:Myelin basic protein n=1 Tax=Bos taurus TaxID=9913 RepID=A0A3Q1MRJ3_BOVIN
MAAQKRPSQRSKYLASASTMDHARHGFLPRHRDTGILDSLGRFFGSDRGAPKRGSGKDGHHAARTTHYGSLPQKAQHGRPQDENPVVHFFKNIAQTASLTLSCRGLRARSQDSAMEAERLTTNRLTRDSRGTTPRARFPKSSSWEDETAVPGPRWQDAEAQLPSQNPVPSFLIQPPRR